MPLTRITVTLPFDLVRAADALAERLRRSRSRVVAEALRSYVQGRAPRVGEPPPASWQGAAPGSVPGATDDDLLAELRRRLGMATDAGEASATSPGAGGPATPVLAYDGERLADLCRRYHIRRLSLFGSVLRDDFGPDSDVDVLVEFEPGRTPGLGIVDIEDELSGLFGGRRVDLLTEKSLHRLIRSRVLESAQVQYVA